MHKHRTVFSVAIITSLLLLAVSCSTTQISNSEGVYSSDQARSGAELYARECAFCHGGTLRGSEAGSALIGEAFWTHWAGQPLADLFEVTKNTMPVSNPNGLTSRQYTEILAFILRQNGLPVGRESLSIEQEGLANILLERPDTLAAIEPGIENLPTSRSIDAEWLSYHGDAAGTRYSPLTLINKDNVGDLQVEWRWYGTNYGSSPEFNYEATPLMVDGVLYTTAGKTRSVVAIDAISGETLWMYRMDPKERLAISARINSGRGLAVWQYEDETRLLFVTPGYQLVALDPITGDVIDGFGQDGVVDLRSRFDPRFDIFGMSIGLTSPPIVIDDVVVIGAAFLPGGTPVSRKNPAGNIRGFDVRTGEQRWSFRTVPQPGEFGIETWENNSWSYTGNAGSWASLSADIERGLVYIPVEEATGDFYGGHRPGDNLFSQSLVCLDAKTGERLWHFQMVHHGIWDYDPAAAPVLMDLKVDGESIPAIIQATKQGFLYSFNRVTGKPIWPIEERPVPASTIPGEKTSPTQPFPTWPVPFDRQGVSEEDLIDFTPEIYAEAFRIISNVTIGPLYTPPSLIEDGGNQGTLVVPGFGGGSNWHGTAYDPEHRILFVPSMTNPMVVGMSAEPTKSDMDYVRTNKNVMIGGPFGLPLFKPPWGRITAFDMNSGEVLWMKANSDTPEEVRNHEKLKGIKLPRTGRASKSGLLVTSTLLFAGEGGGIGRSGRGGNNILWALDKLTGEVVAEIELPSNQTGLPMTYAINGRQYIVVPISGKGHPAELVALSIPEVAP